MRTLILNRDLKTLLQGAAAVAVAGLLMGAIAHPNLRGEGDAEGPQMLMNGGGERGLQAISDPGVSVYRGRVPEYVIGTDWTRPRAEVDKSEAAAPEEELPVDEAPAVVFTGSDDAVPMQVTRAAWRDEPREPTHYPSARGGEVYEANRPAPPAPPADDDVIDPN